MTEIQIPSSYDGTLQPSLLHLSDSPEKRPLLVGLHTWSYDRFNQVNDLLPFAKEMDFNLILPEFRGPNLTTNPSPTMACASEAAMRDIRDAVEYVLAQGWADPDHVFLYGASGGGHMALMMAGYCPDLFEAIASFVPITDLEAWAGQNPYYTPHILACTESDPAQMAKRSPMSYLEGIARANVKIFHGKYDPSVPFTHSVNLFNAILAQNPTARVFLDIFDGGHDTDLHKTKCWFDSQYHHTKETAVSG
jgi:poly(3-hydroxybutyrate) depolymerase